MSNELKKFGLQISKKSLLLREDITQDDLNDFVDIKTYEDDSHLKRKLLKHLPSGELYFYEYREEIDWMNGNDPQYRSYIPVSSEEVADDMNELGMVEILGCQPRIMNDWLADGTRNVKWVGLRSQ